MIRGAVLGLMTAFLVSSCAVGDAIDATSEGPVVNRESPADSTMHGSSGFVVEPTSRFTLSFVADRSVSVVGRVRAPRITAYGAPDEAGPKVAELDNPTEVGGPLVFQLVDARPDLDRHWIEVYLPIRPNGSTGWIKRDQVELSRNPYRIEIDASQHQLRVFKEDDLWLDATVAIGTGATPTPRGRFYITELLQPPRPDGPYGPYAFGLSGFSETLTDYAGGDGVVGIHGTDDPSSLGTDVSHGCIRLANDTIDSLAGVLPLGTPVYIRD